MNHKEYVLTHIKEINELLDFEYSSPDHFNKEDPLDELVFILLSRRTRGIGYETAFNNIKTRYPNWEDVIKSSPDELLDIIEHAGLGPKRVREIVNNLNTIYNRFGLFSLNKLKRWSDKKVFEFLTSLEGIGPKSAYCVMMYSLKRKVFPVDTHVSRICQRLGLIEMGLNHKNAQPMLEDMFPKSLRHSIHVNMVSHGRKICLSRNPRCSDCIIAGFCNWIRQEKDKDLGDPKFADLFAGAGGMSLGFENAGFKLCFANDSDYRSCSTTLHNRTTVVADKIIHMNIKELNPRKFAFRGIKVIVAGPPCQEFSPVRKNGYGTSGRNELYKEVLRFVKFIKPVFVVIENVPGMASHANRVYVDKVEDGLRGLGYAVKSDMINIKKYGVPQNRLRLFFIARRVYRGATEVAEKAVNRVWDSIYLQKSNRFVSFKKGVSGLPKLKPGEGADILRGAGRGRPSNFARKMDHNGNIIFNHIARKHNPRDIEAYAIMSEGENAIDLYNKRPDLMPYSTDHFHTKFYKIRADKPAPTIVAHLRKDANSFIHPRDNRGITPREAARLQSFPDNYRFLGTFGIQFEQIGNAVPPLMAEVIAKAIKRELIKNGGDES